MYQKKCQLVNPEKSCLISRTISRLIFLITFFFAPTLVMFSPVSASAFFSPGVQAHCALPLYMAALQQGRASQGSKKENLRKQTRYYNKKIVALDKAINDIKSNIKKAKKKIGKGIGDYSEVEARGHVVDQIYEYMRKGWDPEKAEETYCFSGFSYYPGNQRNLHIASYFEAFRPPFSFEFLQAITKKSFYVLVPEAAADGSATPANPDCVVAHAAKRPGASGLCYCIHGRVSGSGDFRPGTSGVSCKPPPASGPDCTGKTGQELCQCQGKAWYQGRCVLSDYAEEQCENGGGTWNGSSKTCTPASDPDPCAGKTGQELCQCQGKAWYQGRCVLSDYAEEQCENGGGTWNGGSKTCTPAATTSGATTSGATTTGATTSGATTTGATTSGATTTGATTSGATTTGATTSGATTTGATTSGATTTGATTSGATTTGATTSGATTTGATTSGATTGGGGTTATPAPDCEHWKRWKGCAEEDGKGEITERLCRHPQSCTRGGRPLNRNDVPVFPATYPGTSTPHPQAGQPEYRPVRPDVCQEALESLEDLIKRLKEKEKQRKKFDDLLKAAGQTLEDIEYAEITGTTEAQECATCDLNRLREIKDIIDPAPSGWDVLGNVIGTVGAAALGYYGIREANKLRDRQGFSAQPGYALGLAYPFIMKGLYGGGIFGSSSSSLACSPTMGGMGGGVFGNPFLMQQMMQAQQMQYMQQMHLMRAFYSSMPGMMGGGMMPMMGGGMMPMMGGGMMPGGGIGFVAGGMMPMMGGGMMPMMGGGMMPMMGGGMMPMMGGGMMPGGGMAGMMGGGMMGGGMMPGGGMAGMEAYIRYQQAQLAYQQAQMNNYMQRYQAASGLYSEINRLQMQIYQIMYGGGGFSAHPDTGGGGDDDDDADTGGGGDDDGGDVIRGI